MFLLLPCCQNKVSFSHYVLRRLVSSLFTCCGTCMLYGTPGMPNSSASCDVCLYTARLATLRTPKIYTLFILTCQLCSSEKHCTNMVIAQNAMSGLMVPYEFDMIMPNSSEFSPISLWCCQKQCGFPRAD